MPEGVEYVEMEFEEYSNLIVVPIKVNNLLTLKFILDTGAESTILTEKLFGDLLQLNYVREIHVQGPGLIDSLEAYVATGVSMSLPGGIRARGINMLVLKEDYLELNKNLGEEIYGIIGYDLFSRFVVRIDYDDHLIRIYDPQQFKPRRRDTEIPLHVKNTKPYLSMSLRQKQKTDSVTLMVDSGASHALLLDVNNTEEISMPDKVISTRLGQGLGGVIPGFMGRMTQCQIADFAFDDVLVSIPQEGAYLKAIKRGARHGTMGGDLLSRFSVTFDYPHEKLYLRKGGRYYDDFEYNMSGMIVNADGEELDSLFVTMVQKDSPAAEVDMRAGDLILRINGMNLENSSISDIHALLRRRDGMKIRVWLLRNGEKIKKVFRLKRMI